MVQIPNTSSKNVNIDLFNNAISDNNPKTARGAKKPDLSVVPPAALLHLATAMMNGADKYGPFNWRDTPISARTYVAAAMRHLLAYLDGENFSPDTAEAGRPVHHLVHVMACCAIALDATEIGIIQDNRPRVPGPTGAMIESYNKGSIFVAVPTSSALRAALRAECTAFSAANAANAGQISTTNTVTSAGVVHTGTCQIAGASK